MQRSSFPDNPAERLPGPQTDGREMISFRRGAIHWQCQQRCEEILFDAHGLRIEEWLRTGNAQIVKTGPHRTVYRLTLADGTFYLKCYRIPDWQAVLQNVVRPCKARLEWRAACEIASLGLRTFQPVAVGQKQVGPLELESYLISRAIEQVIPFKQFLLEELPNLPEREQAALRQDLAWKLGRITGTLHGGKLIHPDLHADNLLVRRNESGLLDIWLIDLHSVRAGRPPSAWQVRRDLARLHQSLIRYSTASDRCRFFQTYWDTQKATARGMARILSAGPRNEPHRAGILARNQAARRIEAYCQRVIHQAWRKADRKWARGNRRVIIADSAPVRCRGIAAMGRMRISAVRDNPEKLFAGADVRTWSTSSRKYRSAAIHWKWSADAPGRYAFQAMESRRWLDRWRLGRFSTVRRAWEVGHALLRRGIATPQPLLFVDQPSPGTSRQYLLTESIPDAITLVSGLQQISAEDRKAECESWSTQAIPGLADCVRRLHDCGFDHDELIAENLLVSAPPHPPKFWILKPEAICQRRRLPTRRIVRNLACLNASLRSIPVVRNTHRLRFLRLYLKGYGRREWKTWWRRIARLTSRQLLPPVAWKEGNGQSQSEAGGESQPKSPGFVGKRVLSAGGRMAGLILLGMALTLGGCRAAPSPGQNIVSLPAKHSVQAEQFLVLSDFKIDRSHPLFQDLTQLRLQIAETLDLPLTGRQVVIYLFSNELEYRQYIDATYPELPARRAYFVGMPEELAVYTFWGDRIQEDLRHEFTHGLLHANLQTVPLWLDEGLAEYFEVIGPIPGQVNRDYVSILSNSLANGWRPNLQRLESLEYVSQMQRLDYQESWSWVHYLLHSTADNKMVLLNYLQELKTSSSPKPLSAELGSPSQRTERIISHIASLNLPGQMRY